MTLTTQFNLPGTHKLMLSGGLGLLEAELHVPEEPNPHYLALLGHPHSLQGGTMHNKVVTTLARTFGALSIRSLRFNFRGVGQSMGVYDAGMGESQDMMLLAQQCLEIKPGLQVIYAGFSFGSYVAYRSAAMTNSRLLITIAPPVGNFDYQACEKVPAPWLIVQGGADEVVSSAQVVEFADQLDLELIYFPETGHFFHGQLIELKERLKSAVCEQLNL